MLNEFGLRIWSHKTKPHVVTREYEWCNVVIVTDESEGRRVIEVTEFSTFDFTDWIEWDQEKYDRACQPPKPMKVAWHVSYETINDDFLLPEDTVGVFSTLKKAWKHCKELAGDKFDDLEIDISHIHNLNPMIILSGQINDVLGWLYFEMWELDNGWKRKDFGWDKD